MEHSSYSKAVLCYLGKDGTETKLAFTFLNWKRIVEVLNFIMPIHKQFL